MSDFNQYDHLIDFDTLQLKYAATPKTRVCKVCGTVFKPNDNKHLSCSHRCTQRLYLARRKARELQEAEQTTPVTPVNE
ncbi:MAG: hypothetical protein ACOH2I_11505 [Pseudomonas sp.]